MTRKRSIALLMGVAMLVTVAPAGATTDSLSIEPACGDAPSGRFDDVSGSHADAIDCIGWWGVTQGVGDGLYDPAGQVTRAQMATFVARTIDLSGGELPTEPPDAFIDDDGNTHETSIDQLAELGVVGGVSASAYDPSGSVTRGQMAAFLARAWEARTGDALPRGSAPFEDIGGTTHEANIRRVAEAGLTGGTSPGVYDPGAFVTRAQMGSFLARFLAKLVTDGVTDYPPADPVPIDTPPPPPSDGAGTRADPFPIGETVEVGDGFTLSVRSTTPDATQMVLDENQFNDPPDAGEQFFIATVRLTSTNNEFARSSTSRLRAVGQGGVSYTPFGDSCGVIPDELPSRQLFLGGTAEGNVCWRIDSDDADSLVLFDDDDQDRRYLDLVGAPAPAADLPDVPAPTGARADPLSPNTAVTLADDWELEVTGSVPDANQLILDENQFNEPPEAGHQFFIVQVRATYRGEEEPDRFGGSSRLRATGLAGAVGYSTFGDSCGVIPDELGNPETFTGGSFEGNLCFQVRESDVGSLLLYDDPPFGEVPDAFFAIP